MKTDQLITVLARGLEPADRRAPARAFLTALPLGVTAAVGLLLVLSGLNPMLRAYFSEPMFWTKLGFGLTLAATSLWIATRLARPGVPVSAAVLSLPLVPVAGLWLLAGPALADALPGERAALIWGQTWINCLIGIPLLAAPVLAGTLFALRSLASTQPGRTGAAAGAVAGGLGATVYALQCPELAAPFLAVWYVVGALIPVTAGAFIGRLALRW